MVIKVFYPDNYNAIKRFIDVRDKYIENGLIVSGNEYSDWLAMDGEVLNGTRDCGRTDKYFIANVLH